jgi:hypothetical protein
VGVGVGAELPEGSRPLSQTLLAADIALLLY